MEKKDELDGALLLDGGDRGLNILGHDITTEKQAASHELSVPRVALDHLVARLEGGHSQLVDRVLLVSSLGRRNNRGIGGEREVDTRETWIIISWRLITIIKCTYRTKLVWNSLRLTFRLPSNWSEAVTLDTT
jgi:hypothetical protein